MNIYLIIFLVYSVILGSSRVVNTFQSSSNRRNLEIRCPKPNGLFPHPTDCSKYVNCGEGRAHVQGCNAGLLYNPTRRYCDWPHNVHCKIASGPFTTTTTAAYPVTEKQRQREIVFPNQLRIKCPGLNGLFTYQENCSKFINCDWGKGEIQSCGTGTMFNHKTGNCDWPSNVDCSRKPFKIPGKDKHTIPPKKHKKDPMIERGSMCLRPTGQFPYAKDCSKYINCWNGRALLQKCASGTLFDASSSRCGWPHEAICKTKLAKEVFDSSLPKEEELEIRKYVETGQLFRLSSGGAPHVGYLMVWKDDSWNPVVMDSRKFIYKDALCSAIGYERGAISESRGLVYGEILERPNQAFWCRKTEERALDKCQLSSENLNEIYRAILGIRCRKNSHSECAPGWYRWGTKCYMVSDDMKSHKRARKVCKTKGGRLVTITSQLENDFISQLLTSITDDKHTSFHTGGHFSRPILRRNPGSFLWRDYIKKNEEKVFEKFWVDAGTNDKSIKPKWRSMQNCIIVQNYFQNADGKEEKMIESLYYFWKIESCKRKLRYLCEADSLDIGCIDEQGESYTGSANVTSSGQQCQVWSRVDGVFNALRSLPSLRGNRCSNPDGDIMPWCFVEGAGTKTEFCDIKRCDPAILSDDSGTSKPDKVQVEETPKCSKVAFLCKSSGTCVTWERLCDGSKDCPDGSDELDCPDHLVLFGMKGGKNLLDNDVERWSSIPEAKFCATKCIQARNFICQSFNYHSSREMCILSKSSAKVVGNLVSKFGWEYHERFEMAPNCSQSFICSDSLCIDKTKLCDNHRDCLSGEDEFNCFSKTPFTVRLIDGSGPHQGTVQVRVNGVWGRICDNMFDLMDADVICISHLGYERGARKIFKGSHFGTDAGSGPVMADYMNCVGNESSILDCNFPGWNGKDCSDTEAAGVQCYLPTDTCLETEWECEDSRCIPMKFYCDKIVDCRDGSDEQAERCLLPPDIRLSVPEPSYFDSFSGFGFGSSSDSSFKRSSDDASIKGRVEIRYNGLWGTICDDDITIAEGHVICRTIGFAGAIKVFKNHTFGPGTGPIWIDGLRCKGTEATIFDCVHDPWGQSNCDHSEDLGIECSPKKEKLISDKIEKSFSSAHARLSSTLPSNCGKRFVDDDPNRVVIRPRILQGYLPQPGTQPWMANIRRVTLGGSVHECGGFILTEDLILSAAHCTIKYKPSQYIIRTGDFDNQKSDIHEQEWRIEKIIRHEEFDRGVMFNNDICIVKIKRKENQGIRFSERVQPICIVDHEWKYPSQLNCTVSGWGSLTIESGFSRLLQTTILPILSDEICRADFTYGPYRVTENMFCAGYLEGGIDACQGDSGGPLVCNLEGSYTAVGIISWGHGCARANKPGVYTKLSQYHEWIHKVVKKLKDSEMNTA